jgi:NTE family protein
LVTLIAAAVLSAAAPASATAVPATAHRTCVAFSGGGARGLAHIGVMEALEAEGILIDCVAGTSMGALVGSLYAAGYAPSEMDAIVRSLEWQHVFSGKPVRRLVPLALRFDDVAPLARVGVSRWRLHLPPARDSDYRTNRLLFRLLAEPSYRARGAFDALRRPFRAVAADLETGEQVVLAGGSLARAVRASLSTPVNLVPVRLDGRLLVDGGLVDNLPVGVARGLGADVVLAVDVRSPPLRPTPDDSFVDTTAVVVDMLRLAYNERFLEPPDVSIDLRPALANFGESDYARYPEALEIGRRVGAESIRRARDRLRGRAPVADSSSPASTSPRDRRAESGGLEAATVRDVVVRGAVRVREQFVRGAFGVETGRPFVMNDVLHGMDEVYATGLFESVWLDASPAAAGGATVGVEVREVPRLMLEVGGGYDEGSKARGFLRIRNQNLFGRGERSDTMLLASEGALGLRTALTAERPLGLPVGVFTRGHVIEEKPRFFDRHETLGRAEFDRRGWAVGLQQRVGPAALLRVGVAAETVQTRERPGVPVAAQRESRTAVFGEAGWDILDDAAVPTTGAAATLSVERTLSRTLDFRPYWRAGAQVQAAASPLPRLVVRGGALAALSGGDLPVYEQARLGGPAWMPGFHRDELWGTQALAGSVTAGIAVYRGLRLLGRFGAGNVWDSRGAVRLGGLEGGFGFGLELPTSAGPLALDWGRSAAGHSRVYVSLGFPWPYALRP